MRAATPPPTSGLPSVADAFLRLRLVLSLAAATAIAAGCGRSDGSTPTSPDFVSAPSPGLRVLSISPNTDPVDFGAVSSPFQTTPPVTYVATPTTVTFTVTNTGTKPTGGLSLSITGTGAAAYSIRKGDNGCTGGLGPNKSCTVKVTFAPTAIATYLATLTVSGGQLTSGVSANLTGAGGGRLTIHQVVSGPDVTAGYTTTGGLNPSTFQLANGGTQDFPGLAAGSYSVTLTMPSGYELDNTTGFGSMSCSGNWTSGNNILDPSTNTISLTVLAGSQDGADCTFRIIQSP
jgi:hypothetical protein